MSPTSAELMNNNSTFGADGSPAGNGSLSENVRMFQSLHVLHSKKEDGDDEGGDDGISDSYSSEESGLTQNFG